MSPLVQYSFDEFKTDVLRYAVDSVKQLSDDEILDASLSEKLEKIVNEACFEVATIATSPQRGKRRIQKPRYSSYDDDEEGWDVVDVYIPFEGAGESFSVVPPKGVNMDIDARIEENSLIATFIDDDYLKQGLHDYMQSVTANLALLRQAMEPFRNKVRDAVDAAAKERRQTIDCRKVRHSELGFPID